MLSPGLEPVRWGSATLVRLFRIMPESPLVEREPGSKQSRRYRSLQRGISRLKVVLVFACAGWAATDYERTAEGV